MIYNKHLPPLNTCSVAVIGMGYVGLPIADKINKTKISFLDKKKLNRKVIGFDLNTDRVEELQKGYDRNNIFSEDSFDYPKKIKFSADNNCLLNIDVYIITVPTPLKDFNEPDLSFLENASKIVGHSIRESINKDNQIIIFESTVYPGVTEEVCVPLIEKTSGKIFNSEIYKNTFFCGYSPERINPGDNLNTIDSIIKVTSGSNCEVSAWIDSFYGSFIRAGTYNVRDIKVAEAAKIIENTQRDINIALVNEFALLFNKMNINTKEVLQAANTKWNFHDYYPGLVGGHCIGVDPYYLTFKASKIGFKTELICAGRSINDKMYEYLIEKIIHQLNLVLQIP